MYPHVYGSLPRCANLVVAAVLRDSVCMGRVIAAMRIADCCCNLCCMLFACKVERFALTILKQTLLLLLFLCPLVLHSQGLRNQQNVDLCLEWLRWGLGNSQRVGQAYGIKTLNCHRNALLLLVYY